MSEVGNAFRITICMSENMTIFSDMMFLYICVEISLSPFMVLHLFISLFLVFNVLW